MTGGNEQQAASASRAFGAVNRARLIETYFQQKGTRVDLQTAWADVYRMLLWVDRTTGLGHCYESDKSQPGRKWYERSLAFHAWVSAALTTPPADLARIVDWLFLRASEDLATQVLRNAAKIAERADKQRQPYEGQGFPLPGDDPELISIVRSGLGEHLASEPPPEVWSNLVERVRQYLNLDNKRKNLVGEGFEDVIAEVVRRVVPNDGLEVFTRKALHELPGFNRVRSGDKPNKVDVAIVTPTMRTVVTAKWSVRADREKQFITDFADYVAAESARKPFSYVLVTNEFDPARLMRACEQLSANAPMFTTVVHISTEALRATYAAGATEAKEATSIQKVLSHIDEGRLISLQAWLASMATR